MPELLTFQQKVDAFVNAARKVADRAEDYDRKILRDGNGNAANLADPIFGLSETEITTKLKMRIKPEWDNFRQAEATMLAELQGIDGAIE
ncbi:hypothetical protein [Nitrososphaera viennensis]|uniref:Uncharacterized protein n=2 Tax=Nitrososphaera viennensis TaxID=1034015 RepID=A0A060HU68_9ARCH|nr:hypothetical protein [Nitrososphaera viennensis]AIC16961.1 hypothetical protein NVIE_026890 [Nitrososphaera viennensis EN76]UVS68864.1 hypothetical protein NWT39_13265 [Nitrososphaera viennensis]CBX88971.1 hypothetical protein [Nitrososphaera phage Pro-Nvie1]